MSTDNSKGQVKSQVSGAWHQKVFEERRRYPRLIVKHRVEVRTSIGDLVDAVVHDISPDGLQVRCDRKAAKLIHPSGAFIKPEDAPEVDIRLSVALKKGEVEVKADCRLVYIAVVPGSIAFGMKFTKFDGDSANVLRRFIEESMEPA